MDAELKKKQLSSYLSEEDTERMSSMIGRSKKEVLGDALVRLDVVEKPEYLRGTAVLNNITGGGELDSQSDNTASQTSPTNPRMS